CYTQILIAEVPSNGSGVAKAAKHILFSRAFIYKTTNGTQPFFISQNYTSTTIRLKFSSSIINGLKSVPRASFNLVLRINNCFNLHIAHITQKNYN
ncbi:MAG: hypothetical protein HY929_08770, partial [Euryarchaeota archaeon]|nr:hypothetical protein [Euryarchaeota archaeon]